MLLEAPLSAEAVASVEAFAGVSSSELPHAPRSAVPVAPVVQAVPSAGVWLKDGGGLQSNGDWTAPRSSYAFKDLRASISGFIGHHKLTDRLAERLKAGSSEPLLSAGEETSLRKVFGVSGGTRDSECGRSS